MRQQAQPFGDGEHDVEAHGGLAEPAEEDDLRGGSVEVFHLDRRRRPPRPPARRFEEQACAVHAVGPIAQAERRQEEEQRLVRLR